MPLAKSNEDFKHLSGIVHNAGTISPIENMLDVREIVGSEFVNVNLIGVQDLTQSLDMLIGGDSHTRVITISSGAAKRLCTVGVRIVSLKQV